jgi:lipopolysaccharide transport system permease protein
MLSVGAYLEYKDVISNLVSADLKSRYRNSSLGFLWSLLNPLLMSAVLIFVFIHVFRFQIDNYPLYVLTGVIAWRFFAFTSGTMKSIVSSPSLVSKVYFPREILVVSSCLSALVTACLEFSVLVIFSFFLGGTLSPWILLVPAFLAIQFFLVLGISLALSSLFVYYRDLQHIWEILLQVGFYAAPIIYPSTLIPQSSPYYWVILANPMSHFVITYRHLIISGDAPALGSLIGIAFFTSACMLAGWLIFRRLEPRFAEEL